MKSLAIIGMGPRGLYALENFLNQFSKYNKQINLLVFEASDTPGAGSVWHVQQPESNWINITERALVGLEERPKIVYNNTTIEDFPSYHNWCNFSQTEEEPDRFPPRKKLGIYLNERFNSIANSLKESKGFRVVKSNVTSLELKDNAVLIKSEEASWTCDDVLLTIGHQPTKLSEQLETWKTYFEDKNHIKLFKEPYPIEHLRSIKNKENQTIGIRGFGLAMIDVMRNLVINDYGNFKTVDNTTFQTVYYKVKEQGLRLIPFSLDGLPMGPKPINEKIDNWYKPSENELSFIKNKIESITETQRDTNKIDFLIKPMAKIGAKVFERLGNRTSQHHLETASIEAIIVNFLNDDDYKHELIQDKTIATYDLISAYVNMALGKASVSLDYCIWQVWRHCQPMLYKTISHAILNNETINKVISLDERSKRFSYGPPLESMQQILALVDANIIDLSFTNNPDIKLIETGWELKNKSKDTVVCNAMINSVLDPPQLLKINSPLILNLLNDDLIQPVHSDLGIETKANGYVVSDDEDKHIPIAILGRLVKGSVLGVDAILECFGKRIEDWAESYVKKLTD